MQLSHGGTEVGEDTLFVFKDQVVNFGTFSSSSACTSEYWIPGRIYDSCLPLQVHHHVELFKQRAANLHSVARRRFVKHFFAFVGASLLLVKIAMSEVAVSIVGGIMLHSWARLLIITPSTNKWVTDPSNASKVIAAWQRANMGLTLWLTIDENSTLNVLQLSQLSQVMSIVWTGVFSIEPSLQWCQCHPTWWLPSFLRECAIAFNNNIFLVPPWLWMSMRHWGGCCLAKCKWRWVVTMSWVIFCFSFKPMHIFSCVSCASIQ